MAKSDASNQAVNPSTLEEWNLLGSALVDRVYLWCASPSRSTAFTCPTTEPIAAFSETLSGLLVIKISCGIVL